MATSVAVVGAGPAAGRTAGSSIGRAPDLLAAVATRRLGDSGGCGGAPGEFKERSTP